MGLLIDGVNNQNYVSDRIPLPVDVVSDTAYVNSITGETVQLYYFANAYLTTGTAGTTNAATWAALTDTSKFEIDIRGKTYVINPDFTGDSDMDAVAASIQAAIRAATGTLETCTQSTNVFTITCIKDETGTMDGEYGNSISVLRNTATNTGVNLAGATWMNGLYGTGVVTPATLTSDSGQAAGTIVMAKLAFTGILDKLGGMIGNAADSSLTWTTNTVLPKKYMKECLKSPIEDPSNKELCEIAYEICSRFTTNGEWCLDHRTGLIFGKKATTGTSDTAAYKVQTQTTGGGTVITDSINIAKVAGATVGLDDAAYGVGTAGVLPSGFLADEASTDSVDEGDLGAARMTLNRRQIMAGQTLDDAAFGIGTEYANATGFLADETATDSVDEGDIGIARMTLTRKQITASEFVEDTAHTTADYGSQVLAVRNDAHTALAGTTGDYIPLTTNATGDVYVDTELPAAAALADATANPTVPTVGSGNLTFNGTTWDRARSGVTSPTATLTGMQNILPMGEYLSTEPTLTTGQVDVLQLNTKGHLKNAEQWAPTAEDNTSYTYYTTLRPIATAADPNSHANIMTLVNSAALETSHILKAAPGRLYKARVELDSTATSGVYYIQALNSATLPADGAVTHLVAPMKVHHTYGMTDVIDMDFPYGVYASAGIVVVLSSTQYTKTIGGAFLNIEGHVC
jgi:hypothetical protein